MRFLAILAACAVFALGQPAFVPAQGAVNPSTTEPSGGEPGRVFTTIVVTELDSLPNSVREEVKAAISQRKSEELDGLRRSIDAIPEASAALKAKGKSAAEVIAAAIDKEGTLLLITTTAV